MGDDIEPGPTVILHAPQRGEPNRRGEFTHPALERLQFHTGAEPAERLLIAGRRDRTIDRVAVGRGEARQVGFEVQTELLPQLLGVAVGRGPVVAVVDPKHGDVGLLLNHQVKKCRLVRTKVR